MSAFQQSILGYVPFIGLRYSFSRKRNRFTSVIATISMLGMVLGVASLILVLSIMNGFSAELRGRILSLVPHGFLESRSGDISDWRSLRMQVEGHTDIIAAAPYITEKAIMASGRTLQGVVLTAVDPGLQSAVSGLAGAMTVGQLDSLEQSGFNVVLGVALADMLGVSLGEYVAVTVPRLTVTPLGLFPRSKRLRVTGLFEIGAQPDGYQAYVSLDTGQKLFGSKGVIDGLEIKTTDLFLAPQILQDLNVALAHRFLIKDWSQTQGSLFRAVKMEKMMVSVLLLSVVAVAAFNIVSTLVMSVSEKRRDIAVLRTMGARATGIMLIFMAHGLALAMVGILFGVIFGVLLALNIASITASIESAFGVKLFDPTVYFISELPSALHAADVAAVVLASFALSLLATLYPAWRASRIAPAEVLRYE